MFRLLPDSTHARTRTHARRPAYPAPTAGPGPCQNGPQSRQDARRRAEPYEPETNTRPTVCARVRARARRARRGTCADRTSPRRRQVDYHRARQVVHANTHARANDRHANAPPTDYHRDRTARIRSRIDGDARERPQVPQTRARPYAPAYAPDTHARARARARTRTHANGRETLRLPPAYCARPHMHAPDRLAALRLQLPRTRARFREPAPVRTSRMLLQVPQPVPCRNVDNVHHDALVRPNSHARPGERRALPPRMIIRYPHGIPPSRAPAKLAMATYRLPASRARIARPARPIPPRQTSTGTPSVAFGSQPDGTRCTA